MPIIIGAALCLLGFYFIFRPERGLALHAKMPQSDLDRRQLKEAMREHPKFMRRGARFVGLVLLLIGGLILYGALQR